MRTRLVVAAGLAAVAAFPFAAEAKSPPAANDVSITMKVSGGDTVGPLATLKVKNAGTAAQTGVFLRILAESESGLELWSGTVDLLPRKSAAIQARVYLDQDTTCLVATAAPAAAEDEHPENNAARAALGVKGKAAGPLVGRAIHLAHCASCHPDAGAFAGTTAPEVLAGANDPSRGIGIAFNATDAKNLFGFYRDPEGVVLPPPLPEAPAGGWPTYEGTVKAIFDDRCVNCHGPRKAEAGVWLNTYTAAAKASRKSLGAIRSGRMPQTGPHLAQEQVQAIEDWITGGLRP